MKTRAKTANGLIPAAQYIRMSTEHQRFSPDNQRAANLAYAAAEGYEIIATYQDNGKSGLTLKARPELKRLLSDVLSGAMSYRAILVLDVSRWGRFQDADQAAHYEFMCREAGIPVRYCSEAFDNDGGAMASIVKHMKRVMAAEYSRDLSERLSRAQRLQAGMGYRQGGTPPYGTRRLVVDEAGKPRMILDAGQRKALSTDKVVFVKGPAVEVRQIRRIFQLYVTDEMTISQVCAWMKKRKKIRTDGRAWTYSMISNVLHNEIYKGVYVYGRRLSNLGNETIAPPDQWIRTDVLEPIVQATMFEAAEARLDRRRRSPWSEATLRKGLVRLLRERGYISLPLIDEAEYLPNHGVVTRRFGGSLHKACVAIGYDKALHATRHHVRAYSDQDLLDALVRIHKEKGRLTVSKINADTKSPLASYFARRLGGLKNAYFQAGLNQDRPPLTRAGRHADGTVKSNEELLDDLRVLLGRHGYLSHTLIDAEPAVASGNIYITRFGKLSNIYALVGFSESKADVLRLAWARRRERFEAGAANPDHKLPEAETSIAELIASSSSPIGTGVLVET